MVNTRSTPGAVLPGVTVVITEQASFVVPPQRAVWMPAGVEHEAHMRGHVSLRTLYIDSAAYPNLPKTCRVIEVSALLRELIVDAEGKIDDVVAFTRSSREFHLAVAEASHNRVLVVQLISLQHVSWPARNPTLTAKVARRILDAHEELASLIEIRDAAGAVPPRQRRTPHAGAASQRLPTRPSSPS